MKILITIVVVIITLGSGIAFFLKKAYWPAFGCICIIVLILNMQNISEVWVGKFGLKLKDLVDTLILKKRLVEQPEVQIDSGQGYVILNQEPAIGLTDIYWDNLFIPPNRYSIKGKKIVFDSKDEPITEGEITAIYYAKSTFEKVDK